jgi:hypothetical protein
VSDKWYYTHETAIHGPVSAEELLRLLQSGGLHPADMVWPDGTDAAMAIPAHDALQLLNPAPADLGNTTSASPPAVPDWLPGLADALESGADRSPPTNPSVESWLADVRRSEEPQPPLLKEDVSPKQVNDTTNKGTIPAEPPLLKEDVPPEEVSPGEVPAEKASPEDWRRQPPPRRRSTEEVLPEEASPEVARFYEHTPRRRRSWLSRIPKRFIFIGLGLLIEGVIIYLLLNYWPDKGQETSPTTHTTRRRR